MADKKSQARKELSEEEMKKRYKMLLELGVVEMVDDLKLLDGEPAPDPKKPGGDK